MAAFYQGAMEMAADETLLQRWLWCMYQPSFIMNGLWSAMVGWMSWSCAMRHALRARALSGVSIGTTALLTTCVQLSGRT